MGVIDTFTPSLYFNVGSGGSYSMNSNIKVDTSSWYKADNGFENNVGSTALYSASIGYSFSPLWSFDFEYIYRPSYNYQKRLNYSGFPSATKYFNLKSNSLMGNLYLHGRAVNQNLEWDIGDCYHLEPFIGGGLGVAFNDFSNFHRVFDSNIVESVVPSNLRTSLAWQLSAGLNLYNNSQFNLAAGYRYYNGGTFTSNNYIINTQGLYTPWQGTLQANEFFVKLGYKFNS